MLTSKAIKDILVSLQTQITKKDSQFWVRGNALFHRILFMITIWLINPSQDKKMHKLNGLLAQEGARVNTSITTRFIVQNNQGTHWANLSRVLTHQLIAVVTQRQSKTKTTRSKFSQFRIRPTKLKLMTLLKLLLIKQLINLKIKLWLEIINTKTILKAKYYSKSAFERDAIWIKWIRATGKNAKNVAMTMRIL